MGSSGTYYPCLFHSHTSMHSVSFLSAHKVLHLPGQHTDAFSVSPHKACTTVAWSHCHPDTQKSHPSANEKAALYCPKILIHIFKSHFSSGPRLCWTKHNSSPHKHSEKLAALLPRSLYGHRLLVTQNTS